MIQEEKNELLDVLNVPTRKWDLVIEWVEKKKKEWQEEALQKEYKDTAKFLKKVNKSWEKKLKEAIKPYKKERAECLRNCEEFNGLPYCKNCGLNLEEDSVL
jgi:hypothetical protein